ncbi:MAG: non-canonical purine NTP pyrophosphatase [Spirochaetaceae bacterium]|jgi:XTP/dITP diphosphohydrolase|nr:non-canonical purine NTP pyrophosphatase [Spirochaetaceae bacterium]
MNIWLASGNKHKQQELAAIFADHTLKIPADAGVTGFDPPETGANFAENALIKAGALYNMLNLSSGCPGNHGPVLADDSGLCVDALGGRPGVYSARYYGKDSWDSNGTFRPFGETRPNGAAQPGGRPPLDGMTLKNISDEERNSLLLEEIAAALEKRPQGAMPLQGTGARGCRFVCAMVLFYSKDRFFLVQETLEGEIVPSAAEIRGRGGFGYDPIMYLPELGRTVAELPEEEKNRLSHRGKAGRAIAKLLL